MKNIHEERVIWNEVFYGETFDLRGRINYLRYDECIFVKCMLLMDKATEQVAFTRCTFKDCNVDQIDTDESRAIISSENTFERPLDEQRREFDERLAALLRERGRIIGSS